MSDASDYDSEMFRRHDIDDADAEAFFTGKGAGEDLGSLIVFANELRAVASGPVPVPSLQLAAMLAEGLSTEKGDLLVTAASNVTGPAAQAAGLPKWRTRKKMVIGEFIAGLSVAAKAAFGVGIAAASVTAAGAAGALPAPAQHAVAAAVGAVSPFEFPDTANDKADFGKTVSTDARDGGVDGKDVSDAAKKNGEAHRAAGAGQPGDPGQNGLDQANTTPAAGHAPTALPTGQPSSVGAPGSTGLDQASTTPAANYLPDSIPAGPPAETPPADAGSASGTGLTTADSTPAEGHLPASVPGGRP